MSGMLQCGLSSALSPFYTTPWRFYIQESVLQYCIKVRHTLDRTRENQIIRQVDFELTGSKYKYITTKGQDDGDPLARQIFKLSSVKLKSLGVIQILKQNSTLNLAFWILELMRSWRTHKHNGTELSKVSQRNRETYIIYRACHDGMRDWFMIWWTGMTDDYISFPP